MRTPASPNTPFTLVGRDRELGVLRDHLSAALAKRGSLVLIGGEAGIGKTALAEAACREATEQGALVLTDRCFDLGEVPAYGPWLYLFERYQPGDSLPPHPPAFVEPGIVGDISSQAALFRQVLDFFAALSSARPVMLLLDDLHWADPVSLDLLRFVGQSVAAMSMLIAVTYRSDELTRRHPLYQLLPTLVREADAERVDLRPLDDDAVHTLVHHRYSLPPAEGRRLVKYLQVRAEGNALFLGELLRALQETGTLVEREGKWTLGTLADTGVPPLLRQVIDARVARLDDDSRRLLGVAAVIGQAVPFDVWRAVGEADEERLLAVVAEAEAAHVMIETRDGTGATFTHALIRQALYESIRPSQRRRWHQAAGEKLAALPNVDADAVAHHFGQAGDGRAAEWLIVAGDRAQRAYAWATATVRYQAALTRLETEGTGERERGWLLVRLALLQRVAEPARGVASLEEATRLAAGTGDRLLGAAALFFTGMLRCYAGDFRQGLDEMREAAATLDALDSLPAGDWVRLRAFDPFGVYFSPWARWGNVAFWLVLVGRYDDVTEIAARILAGAATTERQEVASTSHIFVHRSLGMAHAATGHPAKAREAYDRAIAAARTTGNQYWITTNALGYIEDVALPYEADDVARRGAWLAEAGPAWQPTEAGLASDRLPGTHLGWVSALLLEGRWTEVLAACAGLDTARIENSPRHFPVRRVLGYLAYWQGATERAWQMVRESLPEESLTTPGNVIFLPAMAVQRLAARLALDAGDLDLVERWLRAHERWLAWGGAILGQSEGQALWARYHRQAGDAEKGYTCAERALAHAADPRQPLALITAHRLLGELDTDTGRFDNAVAHLDAALALATACAAPFERALTLVALATMCVASGQHGVAQTRLDEARDILTPLDARPTIARVDVLDARLATKSHPAAPAGLTAREVEVLRLVAAGLTNAEVAERLFLSPRTINGHLTAIYTKLNVASRGAAIRFALDHNLR